MIVAKIQVNGAIARTLYKKVIPAGIIGAQVEFEYAEDIWQGLSKTVVFRGPVTKDVVTDANIVTIPQEVTEKPMSLLSVGVYGVDADGNIAIPTIWADMGTVRDAADPSGDTTTDPSLPVWAQIQAMIGNMDDLDTIEKNNLVAAVNEAMTKGGGSVDEAEIQRIVEEYLTANPPTVEETDPTVPAWAKQPEKPAYTAAEVGALSADTLPAAINTALAQAKDSGAFDGAPGENGYSPTASVAQTDTGAVITITDKTGTTTATLKNGADGQPGATGQTPNIQIGTVETLAAGSPATASMGGTPENPILNLGIPQGASGSGGSGIAVSGATVGQTVKISAVDENGVPTAWEPVDLPSGGGTEVWEEIANVTLAEDVISCSITEDLNGQPFKLKKSVLFMRVRGNASGLTGWINPIVKDDATTFTINGAMPSGFKATDGQDNYNSVRVEINLTEVETTSLAVRSVNQTSSKDNLQNWGSFRNNFVNKINPIKWISTIELHSLGLNIGANTEIFVYGVRA